MVVNLVLFAKNILVGIQYFVYGSSRLIYRITGGQYLNILMALDITNGLTVSNWHYLSLETRIPWPWLAPIRIGPGRWLITSVAVSSACRMARWTLVEQNLYRLTDAPRPVTTCINGSEDFAILRDGSYLMAGGSKIYRFDPIRNPQWKEVVDLRFYGIKNISRIESNGFGKLAIVTDS
jgi:hypothetical protein